MGDTMRFAISDSALTEVSEWYEFTEDGDTIRLLIAKPKTSQTMGAASRFKVSSAKPDWKGFLAFMAKNWFLGFEGALDVNGTALEDDEGTRCLMLEASMPLLNFVQEQVRFTSAERDEGNGEPASD